MPCPYRCLKNAQPPLHPVSFPHRWETRFRGEGKLFEETQVTSQQTQSSLQPISRWMRRCTRGFVVSGNDMAKNEVLY